MLTSANAMHHGPMPHATTQTIQRTPDRAAVWDEIWSQRGLVRTFIAAVREGMHTLHRRVLARHLTPETLLLELGCGPATLTLSVAPHIRALVGLDVSEEALRQARQNASARGVTNATFVQGDCRSVPFDRAFDVVWSAGLIEHFFADDVAVVRQHLRAAAPDGIVLLSVPAKYSLHHVHYLLSRPRRLRWLWPWSDVRHFQKFYSLLELRRVGAATGRPARVFSLPPAPLGFLLGILLLELQAPSALDRSPRTS